MYLNFLVNIPIETRKITYRKKGETDYVYYEYTRLYKKGSNITNPKRVTIGKRDTQNPAMMVPNENYLKYFPDEDIPEINERTKRSSCLRIGAWVVIRKIIEECKFTCELKVCSTKKPWNPTVPLALPVAPELSALCVIRPPALKGGKNIFGNNA